MEQILTFALNHWALSGGLILIIFFIVAEEIRNKKDGTKLSPQDATRLINTENAVVIDLREKTLYDNGHIVRAIHLAKSTLNDNLNKITKLKNKPIILVDTSDYQSGTIRQKLHKEGFTRLFILAGGIHAWKEAGLPLVK
ncbi:MAG: putative sulfurtransferase [Gammaproteobacteria bacterium]|jgi:rhodanese-related sulfurtransferase|nr:putative sulfurtransferase [Gammaproteobacteria bacterium]